MACCFLLAACASNQAPLKLEKPDVLPLEINDHYQFRKQDLFLNDPAKQLAVNNSHPNEWVQFERQRMNWGAITGNDFQQRYGHYFSFFWRTSQRADVTCRLEYRQNALGDNVRAQELYYPAAKGSYKSSFKVSGDDYSEGGGVSMWRAILIVDGRIVAIRQSFLWK